MRLTVKGFLALKSISTTAKAWSVVSRAPKLSFATRSVERQFEKYAISVSAGAGPKFEARNYECHFCRKARYAKSVESADSLS